LGKADVTKRSALITGGGKRIGAFLANHLGAKGYHVLLHVNHSRETGADVVSEIINNGGSAQLLVADLARETEVRSMMATALSHEARLSIVINNASYFEYDFPFEGNLEILQKSLAAHVLGPYAIFECLRHGNKGNSITIINMLDQKLESVNPDYYSYTIGKYSLYGMTKIWQSLNLPNIRVFGILLGLTLVSGEQSVQNYEVSRRSNPLGRSPKLTEISDLIDFFVECTSLPGQSVALDGGERLIPRPRDVAYDARLHRFQDDA
jgi:NAD(P)-dependent dehydrogenase (short-subunit alcohol dehydrogenase family)